MHVLSPSITETPNELTADIDVAPPVGIVRLLRAADSQIHNGYRGYPGLCDDEIVEKVVRAVAWAREAVGRRDAAVVISGAGTSGRLAMFAARTFNRYLASRGREPNFRYLMAGGDLALIKAQEGAEDDPHRAWEDLRPLIVGKRRVLYVGVTCGLSAPYVAGQLHRLARRAGARSVLIGFNPEEGARNVEVENWDRTFADVVREIRRRANCMILNPVVGPEPITGSTRMKSGSATKLLLETIFSLAVAPCPGRPADAVRRAFELFERARLATYEQTSAIAELVAFGGRTLRAGGHVYYVGAGTPGILGLVDASECPPTFGADFETVRGFLPGGWRTLLGAGRDLSDRGSAYRISLEDFERDKLPRLTRDDLVVGLGCGSPDPRVLNLLRRSRRAGAAVAMVQTGASRAPRLSLDACVEIRGVPVTVLRGAPVFEEYATKHVLNALTTGAHVLCGKVYRNRMVDLRISNNKLYYRTLGIIQSIMGVSADVAKRCLLRSIYATDRPAPALWEAKPSRHVEAATNVSKVVPKALIMAGSRASHAEAERMIRREPVVRAAIEKLKQGSR